MTHDFVQENEASLWELQAVIEGLNENDFGREVGAGWTVATLLYHLAFWDQRTLYLLKEWQCSQFEAFRLSPQAIHSINEATKILVQAIPGHAAAQLALASAEAVDSEVAKLRDDLLQQIVAAGFERALRRSLHRRVHLSRIQEALKATQ